MNTTPPRENVSDDTSSSNFDPCQAAEELGFLLTRVEALAWATGQALGLPHAITEFGIDADFGTGTPALALVKP